MTAVSEGAAIFAEAVDWDSDEHERKGTHEQIQSDGELGLSFRYVSRTPDKKARIGVVLEREIDGFTLKISSLDTGWDSGLVALKNKAVVAVPLHKRGGHFKSGGTVGVTRNVFANVGVVTSTKLDDKNLTARHKSGGSFIWTRHEDFSATFERQ